MAQATGRRAGSATLDALRGIPPRRVEIRTECDVRVFTTLPLLLLGLGSCAPLGSQNMPVGSTLAAPLDLSGWDLDGNGTWRVQDGRLVLVGAGVPGGAIRRPAALAILKSEPVSRAVVELQVRSMAPVDVLQRDLQVVIGYQSPSRFYYVHLAGLTDAVHNGIFVVADADRRRIDSGNGVPQLRDQAWHDVRVEWNGQTGTIDVFVDGSSQPVLTASDRTLTEGRIGVGSFDDTGEFRRIRIRSVR